MRASSTPLNMKLACERHIPGLLDYAGGRIICAPMSTEASRDGLWLYNLILRYRHRATRPKQDSR